MAGEKDPWKEVRDGFDKWMRFTCYCGFAWILIDILPYLPTHIVDRLIEAALSRLGI